MITGIIEAFRKGVIAGKHKQAVHKFSKEMLHAVMDHKLTDEEVDELCTLYDKLGINKDDWDVMRDHIWEHVLVSAKRRGIDESALRELNGIRAFLGLPHHYGKT